MVNAYEMAELRQLLNRDEHRNVVAVTNGISVHLKDRRYDRSLVSIRTNPDGPGWVYWMHGHFHREDRRWRRKGQDTLTATAAMALNERNKTEGSARRKTEQEKNPMKQKTADAASAVVVQIAEHNNGWIDWTDLAPDDMRLHTLAGDHENAFALLTGNTVSKNGNEYRLGLNRDYLKATLMEVITADDGVDIFLATDGKITITGCELMTRYDRDQS